MKIRYFCGKLGLFLSLSSWFTTYQMKIPTAPPSCNREKIHTAAYKISYKVQHYFKIHICMILVPLSMSMLTYQTLKQNILIESQNDENKMFQTCFDDEKKTQSFRCK